MVDISILEPILSKIENITNKKYLTAKGKPLIFRDLLQLQVVYFALKQYAPYLKNRDVNEDRNHNKRIQSEVDRVTPSAEFLASTEEEKNTLISSMIQTRAEALNGLIQALKSMCRELKYTKKQIEATIPFLRDAMILISENKVDLQQELLELRIIMQKDLFNEDFFDENGALVTKYKTDTYIISSN
jgi:hypothetical protein